MTIQALKAFIQLFIILSIFILGLVRTVDA